MMRALILIINAMHHISKEIDFRKLTLLSLFVAATMLPAFAPIPTYAATATVTTTKTTALTPKNIKIDDFVARIPVHILGMQTADPTGLTPDRIKAAYGLPKTGGTGTIAIVTAFDDKSAESDLATFDTKFGLAACTAKNKCLTTHPMSKTITQNAGWALETALDVEWAHAIAPNAKILLVEATSDGGAALLKAIDYARKQTDVVAVSMSWGGDEFKDETKDDTHFTSDHKIAFFAASGDDGSGASWPAASPNVISVGGTSMTFKSNGGLDAEKAWSGSGGGVSAYEKEPGFQVSYSIAKAQGMRAIPDVAYDADPHSGYSVYHLNGWYTVGGTSAGSPQWAAIKSLGGIASTSSSTLTFLTKLYEDKAAADHAQFFRDITSGSNGDCTFYCDARKHYDYVTGLGTPLTYRF